ncbi:hypothetical protein [Flavisolibacter nicotianae]|uniref:hypothetical protein n=1 Tax=Flavisolibacter nicotianae TaxID=2364882 RepID=UPI000EAE16B2|nr:hypothetical protein [Flavisolibacter nicotianae]
MENAELKNRILPAAERLAPWPVFSQKHALRKITVAAEESFRKAHPAASAIREKKRKIRKPVLMRKRSNVLQEQ